MLVLLYSSMFYLRIYIQIHFFMDFFEWCLITQEKWFFVYWSSLEQLYMKYMNFGTIAYTSYEVYAQVEIDFIFMSLQRNFWFFNDFDCKKFHDNAAKTGNCGPQTWVIANFGTIAYTAYKV